MSDLNIPDELDFEVHNNKLRFSVNGLSTEWMDESDTFISRIDKANLNIALLSKHLEKEIEIKNMLDGAVSLISHEKYRDAISKLDDVLFYDENYAEALLNKSFALCGQKHFVKALRYYKRAVRADECVKNIEYHKNLVKKANTERDNFPKLKLNIFAGDEYFASGDFKKAIESYNSALINPSKFKESILSRLLNKKATALLKLENYEESLKCFDESLNASSNDYAYFGKGICEYSLEMDVNDRFKSQLSLSKNQILRQVLILNELELFEESLVICDFLWKNHFRPDEFYFKLINARRYAMDNLHMDLSEIDNVFDNLALKDD